MMNQANETNDKVEIDLRGLLCPWPALRLARELRLAKAQPQAQSQNQAPKAISQNSQPQQWQILLDQDQNLAEILSIINSFNCQLLTTIESPQSPHRRLLIASSLKNS